MKEPFLGFQSVHQLKPRNLVTLTATSSWVALVSTLNS